MKKLIALSLALIMMLAALASCGGKDVNGSGTTEPTSVSRKDDDSSKTDAVSDSAKDTESETESAVIPIDSDAYTGVRYSGPAELSVLSKAVIIGDSRVLGFELYTTIEKDFGTRVYADEGLSVAKIETSEFVNVDGNYMTVLDALRSNTDYDSVYLALGINEIGLDLAYIGSWLDRFEGVIEKIREINPDAGIYIQAILPVTKERSDSDEIFTKSQIDGYNANLLALAKRLGVNFLNTDEMFADSDGYLPDEGDGGDGIHLNRAFTEKWLTYIAEHRA